MTDAADLLVTNAEVHTLTDPDETYGAFAVRDGRLVRLGSTYDLEFLDGVETERLDLGGRVVLPGFVDAHTHLLETGRALVHADLGGADSRDDCLARLRDQGDAGDGWILGFGYDESNWDDARYLTREDLDAVAESAPVAAVREDMHLASLNSVALDRLATDLPDADVHAGEDGPTGVVVESAVDVLLDAIAPDAAATREYLTAAQTAANERGVTSVHDMVRDPHVPGVYRDLDRDGALTLGVRLNYWADFLDAVETAGLRTNHGTDRVRTGAIKTYTDGSFGGRTAKLSEPYADGDGTGQWVVTPDAVAALTDRVDAAGLQMTAHAIGDEAVDAVLDAYAQCDDPGGARHRVEHAELVSDAALDHFADLGVVASVQPNFLKWAGETGLYADRLGERRTETNRFRDLLDAGVPLAFGSDGMPLDPLFGVHHAVDAPAESQRLSVTEALRAYTRGGAYAGFDEDRLGTLAVGNCADFVALSDSPWEQPDAIADIDVDLTAVGGDVVFDGR